MDVLILHDGGVRLALVIDLDDSFEGGRRHEAHHVGGGGGVLAESQQICQTHDAARVHAMRHISQTDLLDVVPDTERLVGIGLRNV